MKKLMIATAAMMAGVAMADVESANVVGYYNSNLPFGGQLVSGAFLKPGSAEGFHVTSIKIDGYQEDTKFYENNDFNANFSLLDNAGRNLSGKDQKFYYVDVFDWDNTYDFLGGVWQDYQGQAITPGSAADILIEPAQALWFYIPTGDGEHPFTIGSSGEVIANKDVEYTLQFGGNCVGNPFPTGIKVTDLAIDGYQEDTMFYENNDFNANFTLLDNAGRNLDGKDQKFYYEDVFDWDNTYDFLGGVWKDYQSVVIEENGANNFVIPPHQGLWMYIPTGDGEHEFILTFKKITL